MKQGFGLPVFPGIAIGPAVVYKRASQNSPVPSGDPAAEQARFSGALAAARAQLSELMERTAAQFGREQAAIVEVQLLMLEDPELLDGISAAITGGAAAADAVMATAEEFASAFDAMEDPYMNARGADIRDLSRRICGILSGRAEFHLPEGCFLLVADDLSPSETLQLPRERILGLVTGRGSPNSHTAILARTLGIPSLVQADLSPETAQQCTLLAVDGTSGAWYADPDAETLAQLQARQATLRIPDTCRSRESITKSGRKILLCANIGCPEDAAAAIAAGAEGIGLLRSEFLYLGRESLPTEEELFEAYKQVAGIMGSRPVTIRTLDIGGDKQPACIPMEPEDNPALGMRGLRLCLNREDLFLPQLRAIYRASVFGNFSILLPMVTSLWELKDARDLCSKARRQLESQGIPIRDIPIGIMVETPAAAILAREFAAEAAFFSVGTNDLTQYTLAADRQNAALTAFWDSRHPALLALLEHIADAALQAGIPVSICGELAADPDMLEPLLKMGYTELSMAPGRIPEIRMRLCESEV